MKIEAEREISDMKRTTSFLGGVAAFSLCVASAFAQSGVAMPTMPSMPSMPTVGSGFYSPSTSGFYNGNRGQAQKNAASKPAGESSASTGAKTAALDDAAKKVLAEEHESALSATNGNKKDSASSPLSGILTAKDIAALSDLGLVDDIGSALKKHSAVYSEEGKDGLEGLLSDWAKLKEETPKDQKKVSLSSTPAKSEAKILRFTADNADFLSTIKESFFSTESLVVTFLLTGACKYSSGGIARNETFYILFEPDGADGGVTRYKVRATASQDTENPDSVLKKLEAATQNGEVGAYRTGNLVTLRISGESLKLDMLLAM